MKFNYDCIIIGAGVAGMTAAIYLKRAELNICIIEKAAPGGQVNKTSVIDNYPGFVGDGPTLAMTMFHQVNQLNIPYLYGDVQDIIAHDQGYEVITDQQHYTTKKIILATGRIPNKLGLDLEDKLTNHGISWCAICDGPLFRDKTVAVVGSGNSALEESLYLASICDKVILLNRSEKFKGSKMLVDKMKALDNVEIYYETVVKQLHEANGKLSGLTALKDREVFDLKVDGLFIYIGFQPEYQYLKSLSLEKEDGYLKVDSMMQTSMPGIYACGDLIKKEYYQISTAVGEAAIAALSIAKALE